MNKKIQNLIYELCRDCRTRTPQKFQYSFYLEGDKDLHHTYKCSVCGQELDYKDKILRSLK